MNIVDPQNFVDGAVLLFDKPYGWTSFDVVNKVKWKLKYHFKLKIKIGHAGTLDPLATGLVIVCTGKMTKTIDQIQALTKTYDGSLMLGATTPSFDLETEINNTFPTDHIDESAIAHVQEKFVGTIEQTPPIYSAIKMDGKRLYDFARQGKSVEIKSRPITIYDLQLDTANFPEVQFKVVCSKGTYIRTLVDDIGKALDSGAYLKSLRRTQIGDYNLADAISIDDFEKKIEAISQITLPDL